MPFGVCNVPSTFLSLMKKLFQPILCYFFPIFFDDILVYNKTWVAHVELVLQLLFSHQLFPKCSEYAFVVFEVEYLGHNVSGEGVHVDPKKIEVMKD
jgi:hypothetical protein